MSGILLFLGSSCFDADIDWSSSDPLPRLTIDSSSGPVVNRKIASSYSASGTCTESGKAVYVQGAISNQAQCISGTWSSTWDLSAVPDGAVGLEIGQTDPYGRSHAPTTMSLMKDTVPPTNLGISLNGGRGFVYESFVKLTLKASDVAEMQVSNGQCGEDGSGEDGNFIPYSTEILSWPLVNLGPGATNTVFVRFRDTAGNLSECVSASITHHHLEVQAAYPLNGRDWNDYIDNGNQALGPHKQTDTSCNPTKLGGPQACVHGGEIRKAVLQGVSQCTGVSANDELGAFTWICDASSGVATLFSKGLRPGKGLKDLLSAASWKNNRLRVFMGSDLIASSEPAQWWFNPVSDLPDNSSGSSQVVALDAPGKVYTLAQSRSSAGYNITADRVSLVIFAGKALSYNGVNLLNVNLTTGEIATPNFTSLVAGGSQNFLWIEGKFRDLAPGPRIADSGIAFMSIRRSVIQDFSTDGFDQLGLHISGCQALKIQRGISSRNKKFGIFFKASSFNVLDSLQLFNNGVVLSSFGRGVYLQDGSSDNVFMNSILANNNVQGLGVSGGSRNTFVTLTSTNSATGSGFYFNGSTYNTIHQAAAVNNESAGLKIEASSNQISVSQIAVSRNSEAGVLIANSNFGKFMGLLEFGNNGVPECNVTGSVLPGVDPITCQANGFSTSTAISGIDLVNSFVGKVFNDDVVNPDDESGLRIFGLIGDWTSFSNPFRNWGQEGGPFASLNNRGHCRSGLNCRIWDWRLASTDTRLLNRSIQGTVLNPPFLNQEPCPIRGDQTATDRLLVPRTYLLNAVEILGDYVGNDNGLCESNEECLYTPNLGAYQGEGDYTQNSCRFTDGLIQGVKLYAYPHNGV